MCVAAAGAVGEGSGGRSFVVFGQPEAAQDEEGAGAGAHQVVQRVDGVLDRELADGEQVADVRTGPDHPGIRLLLGRILGEAPPGRNEAHGVRDEATEQSKNRRVELVPQEEADPCPDQAALVEAGQRSLAIFQAEQQRCDRAEGECDRGGEHILRSRTRLVGHENQDAEY